MLARRTPFYYGWVIILVTGIAGSFSTGVLFWGLGFFVPLMEADLGWSRSTLFLPLAIGALVSAVLGPTLGHLFDKKHGPRWFFLFGSLLFGLSIMYIREANAVWGYLLVFGLVGGIGRWAMQVGAVVVPKWFVRRRGVAQATALAGAAGGPLIFPVIIEALIAQVGWRDAWFFLGLALVVLMVPGALLIVRSPEDAGLVVDGARPTGPPGSRTAASAPIERSFTRREALRTRLFWILILAIGAGTLGIRGMIPNMAPFFADAGVGSSVSALSFTVYAAVVMPAGFFWGHLADRMGARMPFVMVCATVLSAMALLAFINGQVMLLIVMGYLGFGLGGFWTLGRVTVANSFGRAHIGAIQGVMQPFNNGAMFGAPLLFGLVYDAWESYGVLFTISVTGWAVSLVAAFFLRPHPVAEAVSQPVAAPQRAPGD